MPAEPAVVVPPKVIRTTVAMWYALATFLTLHALFLWLRPEGIAEQLESRADVTAREAADYAADLVLENLLVTLFFGVMYCVFAYLVGRRRRWPRIALTVVGAVQLFLQLSAGFSPVGIVVLLLVLGGLIGLWLPSASRWLAGHDPVAA
ncbi:hypothetical protein [Actinoalloteichus hymeniacidonis]|uniref:Uncharacterized protein n=1 Tax=Actinoalloteichus hymeniacidonis TaxID=340345 RepID=A0AAC9MWS7_9PSEU|nr:hypothetical protein [Actinoalloteichus hymeniacidonis]AOS61321.1 hypothetical protein TL08_02415 [Actinoalloteichus hymeniacidonis]MBB5910674.1 hypothetical protein [Actinoalloteichus hymeniacidonis]